jgi:8-oxo-dGTP pyrophosphatase MutT (NUDIX family)
MSNNPWTIIATKVPYENPWIKVLEHDVLRPDGKEGIYGVVQFKNKAIAIIPLDKKGNTRIIGQYRFPTNTYEWEVPEGGSPEHESALETAHRELREEAGLIAGKMTLIHEFQLSNSTTNEIAYTFVAQDLTEVEQEPDDEEILQMKEIAFEELFQMTMRGEIRDCLSVASIFKLKLMLDNGSISL